MADVTGIADPEPAPVAYLYSRYPVPSQSFCDWEMSGVAAAGQPVVVVSLNPPDTTFRRGGIPGLPERFVYPPHKPAVDALANCEEFQEKLAPLVEDHLARFGEDAKPQVRARNAMWAAAALRPLGVKHLHVHFANRATHTALFLKELGFTYSFTAHAQDFMVDLGDDDLLRDLCEGAEEVIAVSDYSKGLLHERCPGSTGKIRRIYNGINLATFAEVPPDPPPATPSAPGEPMRILSVGRLIEFKGFHRLLEACGLLRERGVLAECTILGEGPWRPKLESLTREHDLSGAVRLPGIASQETIRAALSGCDVFALPCLVDEKGASDILPTVITEAMASGRPVVSTELTGVPEMVVDGVTGLLAPPDDAGAIADHLAALAADPELRARLGAAGKARADELFDLRKTAAEVAAIFKPHCRTTTSALSSGQVATLAPHPSVIVLIDHLTDIDAEIAAALEHPDVLPVICRSDKELVALNPAQAGHAHFLPDANVLEGAWLHEEDHRLLCEALRIALPTSLGGEEYFTQARRACYLATLPQLSGARLVHAHRSAAAPLATILGDLLGTKVTATIEHEPELKRSLLQDLSERWSEASVADPLLSGRLGGKFKNALALPGGTEEKKRTLKDRLARLSGSAGRGEDPPTPPGASPESARAWLDHLARLVSP